MEAYKIFAVAEVCYPYEAALWVALGRIPEGLYAESGADGRKDPYNLYKDHLPADTGPFSAEELCAVDGDEVWTRYFEAKCLSPGVSSVDEYFNGTGREIAYTHPGFAPQGPREEAGFHEAVYVEELERPVWSRIERARLKVLLALMEGKLPAWGLRLAEGYDVIESEAWTLAKTQTLTPSIWSNQPEIWSEQPSQILPGFGAVWTDVQTLLAEFPKPDLAPTEISGLSFGDVFVAASASTDFSTQKFSASVRGRPKAAAGVIATATRNEFARRQKAGLLPDKREAVVADCIMWVEQIFEEKISRSTAQRYLAPISGRKRS